MNRNSKFISYPFEVLSKSHGRLKLPVYKKSAFVCVLNILNWDHDYFE